MKLAIVATNICWRSSRSPSGYATDAGFVIPVRVLAEQFDATKVILPCAFPGNRQGEMELAGKNLTVVPLTPLSASVFLRRLSLPFWLVCNGPRLVREISRADAIHTRVPGDIGVVGTIVAFVWRKPLFVRHLNTWLESRTFGERLERRLLETMAGDSNVVLATGESDEHPSRRNPTIRWIFSTTLSEHELETYAVHRTLSSSRSLRLIIVSRQELAKGTDILIRTLPYVRRKFGNVGLDVVGDGSALPRFKKIAENMGLRDSVTFHGRLNHQRVIDLLQQADLFCLPTQSESFGKAILEALSCGLPVVTTRVPVLLRLVGSRCGVVVNERTPDALAEAITWCLSDPDYYQRMSREALRTARSYSLERWCDIVRERLEAAWGPLRSRIG
jgi:hypothetical protein